MQPADNLKNGDKITVKSIIDEEKAKELGIKFKFSEIKKEVSGLQTAIVISQEELFKDVLVEFTVHHQMPQYKSEICLKTRFCQK